MNDLFERGYRLCTCKKTHLSGDIRFEENEVFYYFKNYNSYSIFKNYYIGYNNEERTSNLTYLTGDFNKHFVDTIELRNQKIDSILNDE